MTIEVQISASGAGRVVGAETTLTLETAKAYVTAFHTDCGCDRVEIEGAGLIEADDATVVRLNVTTHHPEHGTDAVQWDVWAEPCVDRGVYLYGEC